MPHRASYCPTCGSRIEGTRLVIADGVLVHDGIEVRFTAHQAIIVGRLLDKAPMMVTKDVLYGAITESSDPDDQPDPKVVDSHVYHVRQKLKPTGIEVETVRGVGYRIRPSAGLDEAALRKVSEARRVQRAGLRSVMTDHDRAEAERLHARGSNHSTIARQLGLGYSAVHHYLKGRGLAR